MSDIDDELAEALDAMELAARQLLKEKRLLWPAITAHRRAVKRVRDVWRHYRTGATDMPLLDAARLYRTGILGNGHATEELPAGGPPPDAPARKKAASEAILFVGPLDGGWDRVGATLAIERIEGPGKKGTRTVVCRREGCRLARHSRVSPCRCGEVAWDMIGAVVAGNDVPSVVAKIHERNQAKPGESVPAPSDGWDEASLDAAAGRLGVDWADVHFCNRCNAARVRKTQPCPACRCPEYRLASTMVQGRCVARARSQPPRTKGQRKAAAKGECE